MRKYMIYAEISIFHFLVVQVIPSIFFFFELCHLSNKDFGIDFLTALNVYFGKIKKQIGDKGYIRNLRALFEFHIFLNA